MMPVLLQGAFFMLINLWICGGVLALTVTAVLGLAPRASPRGRYGLAVAGFLAAVVVPIVLTLSAEPETAADLVLGSGDADFAVTNAVLALWAAGAAVLLAREAVGSLLLRRRAARWVPAPEALRKQLGWPATVELLVGPDGSPQVVGLWRPAVFLPLTIFAVLSPAAVARIARHELSHAAWRDPLVHRLIRAVRAALWPAAPLWLLERAVRREREAAADAAAVGDGGDARVALAYAESLLAVAEGSIERAPGVGAGGDLEERVRRLLRPVRPRSRIRAATAALFLVAGSVAAVAAAVPVPPAPSAAASALPEDRTPFDRLIGRNPVLRLVTGRESDRSVHVHVDVGEHVHVD